MTYSAQNPIRRFAAPLLLLVVACSQTAPAPATPTAPIASASGPGSIVIGNGVTLDASGSSGEDLAFSWTLLSRPAGSGATLAGAGSASPSFTPDLTGTSPPTAPACSCTSPATPSTWPSTAPSPA